jgi:hypothetical protein
MDAWTLPIPSDDDLRVVTPEERKQGAVRTIERFFDLIAGRGREPDAWEAEMLRVAIQAIAERAYVPAITFCRYLLDAARRRRKSTRTRSAPTSLAQLRALLVAACKVPAPPPSPHADNLV